MRSWQPYPHRERVTALTVACVAAVLVAVAACAIAYATWQDRREFDEAMAEHDRTRVTEQQIQAARVGEEIAMQSRRPRPAGIQVRATFYADTYIGRSMANGMPYLPDQFTCAHRTLPLGTLVELEHQGRSVQLVVTDRGPWDKYPEGHSKAWLYRKELDLSRAAFQALEPNLDKGVITVTARVVKP